MMMKTRHALLALWLACTPAFSASPSVSPPVHPRAAVLPLDARVDGLDYPELTARWWQWAMNATVRPFQDQDGRLCDIGQRGPVWFLAGTTGEDSVHRECVVPLGRHLLLPVINMVYMQRRGGARASCAELQAGAAVNNDKLVSAVVLIDGHAVADIARYRVRSAGCFPISIDTDAHPRPDSPQAASDGYWLLLAPLRPGRHTIVVGANYGAAGDYGNMVQNFDYVLHVGGRTSGI